MKPLVIDLFCGLGGWTDGFLAEGYTCVGFDIERHYYGHGGYPGQLVIQDVLTIHGKQFEDAAVIVASPPCQAYSWMAMPWSLAKQRAAEYRSGVRSVDDLNALFNACFRIQREASEAAGRYIPLIVENVRGAIPWVGRSVWHYGSFHLWGDVPALMPITRSVKVPGVASGVASSVRGDKTGISAVGFNVMACRQLSAAWRAKHYEETAKHGLKLPGNNGPRRWEDREVQRLCDTGTKFSQSGDAWFDDTPRDKMLGDKGPAAYGSKSNSRKAASAQIAKIPYPLSLHLARVFKAGLSPG